MVSTVMGGQFREGSELVMGVLRQGVRTDGKGKVENVGGIRD